ncbi:hypothetical protein P154DRAFT_524629 [Amniculicola lignicola CBS 123094]|uniref:F-box domain-containing protein n=1 Tax=Amniculicola lignicola CBS 123094 TaxID=1392246 RepID=A0A6A5W730_9PLEO|nr:hypothetical protein P154DRAFT_524629 [Amniculicola lignicola CBS 123094]
MSAPTSFRHLDDDILHIIFSYLTSSPTHLLTICQLSRRLSIIAQRYLYYEVSICIRKNTQHAFHRTLLERPDLRPHVQNLDVYFPKEDYPDVHENIDAVITLCPNLRDFAYQGQPYNHWGEPQYYNPIFLRLQPQWKRLQRISWKHQISVELMAQLMLLPGLKSITVQELTHLGEHGYPGHGPDFRLPRGSRGTSTVEELHLSPIQQLPLIAFPQLLLLPRQLKKLKIDGYGMRFAQRDDVVKLLEPVRQGLEELELYNDIGYIGGLEAGFYLGEWVRLKRLAVPFRYFVRSSEEWEGRGLVQYLPAGIEEVKLFILDTDQAIDFKAPVDDDPNYTQTKWLLDLVAAKSTHFPSLRTITLMEQNKSLIVDVTHLLDAVKSKFENAGVRVSFWRG